MQDGAFLAHRSNEWEHWPTVYTQPFSPAQCTQTHNDNYRYVNAPGQNLIFVFVFFPALEQYFLFDNGELLTLF